YNDKLIPLAKEFNLLGVPVAKKYGGRGADNRTFAKVLERIAMEGTGVRTFFSVHSSLGQKLLQRFGTEEQKERYLIPSTRGEVTLAFGLTEPEAGSDPLAMEMAYREEGQGYVLNGVKYLISNAGIADAIITFAKGPKGRISAFIVETEREGIAREELVAKMGMPTSDTAMFELRDYRVQKENLLGEREEGWTVARYGLMNGRLGVAAGCVGIISDCLREAANYAKERVQHGKAIAKHQLIQEHIAYMKTELEAARLMVARAAGLVDEYEAEPTKELREVADAAVAEAKFMATNAAWDAADRAVQIYGGRGWSFLYRPGRHLVDTRVCRIYEGTDEIMKLRIASAYLGKGFEAYK
ncbi:MAG: acyl-CoA dehydrogenase family protein, partial [Candidatus Hydrothermarchaeota archaeon]